MTTDEKNRLLDELLEMEEKNDIGNLTRSERAEFQMWVKDQKKNILDLPNNPTNEDALNYMLRRTFPKCLFIHSRDSANLTEAIHMSQEWLKKPYQEEEAKDWVDKEMAKKYGFVLREEDRLKIRASGAEFLEEVGGEIGSSCEKFIRRMTGNEESEDKENG